MHKAEISVGGKERSFQERRGSLFISDGGIHHQRPERVRDRRDRRVSRVRRSELALPVKIVSKDRSLIRMGGKRTICVIVGIVIVRAGIGRLRLIIIVISILASLQSETESKRTQNNGDGPPAEFGLLLADFTTAGMRSASEPRPASGGRSTAVRVVRVSFFDISRFSPATFAKSERSKQSIDGALEAQTGAKEQQQDNTGNSADDDSGNCTTAQPSVAVCSLDSNQVCPVGSDRCGESFRRGGCRCLRYGAGPVTGLSHSGGGLCACFCSGNRNRGALCNTFTVITLLRSLATSRAALRLAEVDSADASAGGCGNLTTPYGGDSRFVGFRKRVDGGEIFIASAATATICTDGLILTVGCACLPAFTA